MLTSAWGLQRDTGMTYREVVRILTDVSSLVDVSPRIQHLEERQVRGLAL